MKKIIILVCCIGVAFAKFEAIPVKSCEAFNNMKHSKNTHHIYLNTSKKYTILKTHKGQNLILIKGETPAQRWVDQNCFSSHKKIKSVTTQKNTLGQNLLALSWHNAFCETHRYKKECKTTSLLNRPYHATHFILHGLWPQPKNNQYCKVSNKYIGMDKNKQWYRLPSLGLTTTTTKALKEIMPGVSSNLDKHEWIKHGTCYGKDADAYYRDAIGLTKQFNRSMVGKYFSQNIGKKVTLKEIKKLFDSSFGRGAGERVELKCKNGLIGELWLHLGSGNATLSQLLLNGKKVKSRCQGGRIDRSGFVR